LVSDIATTPFPTFCCDNVQQVQTYSSSSGVAFEFTANRTDHSTQLNLDFLDHNFKSHYRQSLRKVCAALHKLQTKYKGPQPTSVNPDFSDHRSLCHDLVKHKQPPTAVFTSWDSDTLDEEVYVLTEMRLRVLKWVRDLEVNQDSSREI
jgi:hypothetical protein